MKRFSWKGYIFLKASVLGKIVTKGMRIILKGKRNCYQKHEKNFER